MTKKTRIEYYRIKYNWDSLCNVSSCYSSCRGGWTRYNMYQHASLCDYHENKYQQYLDKPTINERISNMAKTLRERVRNALRSKEEKLLIETGFTYESGALTKEGRKVVTDLLFEDEAIRTRVVDLAESLKEDDCKKKK